MQFFPRCNNTHRIGIGIANHRYARAGMGGRIFIVDRHKRNLGRKGAEAGAAAALSLAPVPLAALAAAVVSLARARARAD